MDRFASFDGVELAYRVGGEGHPVVLLHGFASDSERDWVRTGVAAALEASGRTVVLLDTRGHGRSDKPHDPAAYADGALARDVQALLDRLDYRTADLCGYSLGARTAMTLAATDARVRSAIFAGVGGRLRNRAMVDHAPTIGEGLTATESTSIEDRVARAFREYADVTGADLEALSALQRSGSFPRTDLGSIGPPTLVIVGEDDRMAGSPEELAGRIPGAEVERVPGDHLTAMSQPEFVGAIAAFLSRVDAADSSE